MILGMSTFTFIHVLITLVPLVAGPIMIYGMLHSDRMNTVTAIFLLFMVLTDLTGFLLPYHSVTPAVTLDIISSVILVPTLLARYTFGMTGFWRPVFVIGAVMSLWFDCFVFVVQAFGKIPALHALAPAGGGPVFGAVQGLVLLCLVVAGFFAVRRFHPR